MWHQVYTPVEGNLGLSALVAAIPIFVLVYTLGIQKMPSWKASLIGLGAAELLAVLVYRMPVAQSIAAVTYGAPFGLFPIGWIVYWAIVLYRVTLETGDGQIRDCQGFHRKSDAGLSPQALLIPSRLVRSSKGRADLEPRWPWPQRCSPDWASRHSMQPPSVCWPTLLRLPSGQSDLR